MAWSVTCEEGQSPLAEVLASQATAPLGAPFTLSPHMGEDEFEAGGRAQGVTLCLTVMDSKGTMASFHAPHPGSAPQLSCSLALASAVLLWPHPGLLTSQKGSSQARDQQA